VGRASASRPLEEMTEPADPLSPRLGAVVLAAGQGTRMRSRLPKVLHPLAGQPMVDHVLAAVMAAGAAEALLVVGREAAEVRAALDGRVRFVEQAKPLGTGDAVRCACAELDASLERVLVVYGDTPLLTGETLRVLATRDPAAAVTMLTMVVADPAGYGRLVRDAAGRVCRLVEDADASGPQREIREVNVGAYVFNAAWLRGALSSLRRSASGEYYLTDLIASAADAGHSVATVQLDDPIEGLGVNDRVQLATAEAVLRERVRERLMRSGVTLIDPASTFVDSTVEVGPDTVLHPHTFLCGHTRVGAGCEIGPSSQVVDTEVGDRCRIWWSVLEEAVLADEVQVGPFSHLRPGARLARGVTLGNYAEVKNSTIGENVQQHHFSYIGDAEVGKDSNIGAGTITCNYDGENKLRTEIGERVFIGSDTMLVAPLKIGSDSATGAGTVVVKDVPEGKLVVGVPGRVVRDRVPPAAAEDNPADASAERPAEPEARSP